MGRIPSSSRFSRLELKQLRVLQALLRERNLSRVADQLGVSQQTISEHLKRLRDLFEDRLFIRTSNGVIPTPFALQLTVKLERVLRDLDNLLEQEEFNPAKIDAVFNISASDFEQRVVLPGLLKVLREQAPHLKVIVHQLEIDLMGQQLLNGQVDLVMSTPDFVPDHYPTMLLYHEYYVCVSCRNSALITHPNQPLTPEQLAPLPQLVVSPSRGDLQGMTDSWFKSFGLQRNVMLSVPSFGAAIECMASTDTLAFLPSQLLPDDRLQSVPLLDHPPGFDVITAWHTRSDQDPLHLWIREILAGQFPTPSSND